MAAGLGFKTFTTGEVLTAADTNGYLMQGILVFASAAARDSAITSPQEGQFAYLKDTNVTTYYTGSAWANVDTTGMTNPMTTTGDTIYSSSGSTPARLGIGSTGQVLTVAGGIPSWATVASSGMTLITTLSPSGVSSSSADNVFTSTYDSYLIVGFLTWTDNTNLTMRLRASGSDITTSTYFADTTSGQGSAGDIYYLSDNRGTNIITGFTIDLTNPGNSNYKMGNLQRTFNATTGGYYSQSFRNSTLSATDGIKFFPTTGTMTGTIRIYGLAK